MACKKDLILNRDLEMCAGDFSQGDSSSKALSTSFLFSFPSPFLSRNKNASTNVSNVASSSGEPIFDVWKKSTSHQIYGTALQTVNPFNTRKTK